MGKGLALYWALCMHPTLLLFGSNQTSCFLRECDFRDFVKLQEFVRLLLLVSSISSPLYLLLVSVLFFAPFWGLEQLFPYTEFSGLICLLASSEHFSLFLTPNSSSRCVWRITLLGHRTYPNLRLADIAEFFLVVLPWLSDCPASQCSTAAGFLCWKLSAFSLGLCFWGAGKQWEHLGSTKGAPLSDSVLEPASVCSRSVGTCTGWVAWEKRPEQCQETSVLFNLSRELFLASHVEVSEMCWLFFRLDPYRPLWEALWNNSKLSQRWHDCTSKAQAGDQSVDGRSQILSHPGLGGHVPSSPAGKNRNPVTCFMGALLLTFT